MSDQPYAAFDEDNLQQLVHRFYDRVRQDAVLGPVFANAIGTEPGDWEPHLQTMTHFWTTIILQKPAYKGNPMAKHRAAPGVQRHHFPMWLALFDATATDLFEPQLRDQLMGRANTMAHHLTNGLFGPVSA